MRLRTRASALALALWVVSLAPAMAQDGWLDRKRLTGDWQGVRPLLSDGGFSPYLTYTGILWSNLAGGEQSGTEFDGYLDCGFDLDLKKLAAWPGSGFHADFHWFQGREPTAVLIGGTASMAIEEWEASNALRVFNLYFRQSFVGDRYQIQAGQIAADTNFMVSRYAGIFLNGAFGDLPTENVNTGTPVYPLAAPGIYVLAKPTDTFTWRTAVYTADAGRDVAGNHGFGWKLGNQAGYAVYAEAAVHAAPVDQPGKYTLGGYYVAGTFPVIGTDETRYGNYNIYVMIDQALAHNAAGNPTVGAFARFSISPQKDRNVAFVYGDAGLNVFAPIAARPNDVVGLAVGILRASGHEETSPGVPSALPRGEAVLELTYQAALTPWLTLQPDLQLLLDPVFSQSDAFVAGIHAIALF